MLEDEVDKVLQEQMVKEKKNDFSASRKFGWLSAVGVAFLLVSVAIIGTWAGYMIQRGTLSPTSGTNVLTITDTSTISQEGDLLDAAQQPVLRGDDRMYFSLPAECTVDVIAVDRDTSSTTVLSVTGADAVSSISVSCSGTLSTSESFVRILVTDTQGRVHLVFGTDSFGLSTGVFSVANIAEETLVCEEGCIPASVTIEVQDATVHVDSLFVVPIKTVRGGLSHLSSRTSVLQNQQRVKAHRWNQRNYEKDMLWIAGENSISALSYEQKKQLFGGELPNLQGFDFYIGGIFSLEEDSVVNTPSQTSGTVSPHCSLPSSWDWRNRHDANDPNSVYFDGDTNLETGWCTAARRQCGCFLNGVINPVICTDDWCTNAGGEWRDCGSCWAHSAVGVVEAMINLYYNQHLDYELSEQEFVTNSNIGTCSGAGASCFKTTLEYVEDPGIIEEEYFPYVANNSGGPYTWDPIIHPRIRGSGSVAATSYAGYSEEDALKKLCIEHGPFHAGWSGGAQSGHAMACVGYGVIEIGMFIVEQAYWPICVEYLHPWLGQTYWIMKNSFGYDWGYLMNGYFYLKVSHSGLQTLFSTAHSMLTPMSITIADTPVETVACLDLDGDGYYNWGIGDKPQGYPAVPDAEDGNDNNSHLGPLNNSYQCTIIGENIVIKQNQNLYLCNSLYDFGYLPNGGSTTVTFTIENPGTTPLSLTGNPPVQVQGSHASSYQVTQPSSTLLQPGQSMSFQVTLDPVSGGPQTATLVIKNNDPYAAPYIILLQGQWEEAYNYNTNTWYLTIQEAIDDASDGAIVIVDDGEYYYPDVTVTLNKGITLRSAHGATSTTINGLNAHRCVKIDHPDAVLQGFTITNGYNSYVSGSAQYFGGGILMTSGTVTQCIIRNNNAGGGGGGISSTGDGHITNSFIVDNSARGFGGGIYAQASVSIENCLIQGNSAIQGGGLFLNPGTSLTVNLVTVTENTVDTVAGINLPATGAGIFAYNANNGVANSIVYNNENELLQEIDNYNAHVNLAYTCTNPTSPPSSGQGNIYADPEFLLLGTPFSHAYSLKSTSPCINAGDPDDILLPLWDLARNPRLIGSRVDMGCYEFQKVVLPGGVSVEVDPEIN
ncbi:MAG: choice-of-anchor D domain-containing protein [Candidatus Thermoplasmatota archaeon]|nr:choice-of-anchor D domain-containing protein [Candidatus Thermoplasmatota archaeon]